nr:MAG TPA: hypothetical protein [Caudoviricetes sp.]
MTGFFRWLSGLVSNPATGRDLCKIPPKSPKFPPRHLGDFP